MTSDALFTLLRFVLLAGLMRSGPDPYQTPTKYRTTYDFVVGSVYARGLLFISYLDT